MFTHFLRSVSQLEPLDDQRLYISTIYSPFALSVCPWNVDGLDCILGPFPNGILLRFQAGAHRRSGNRTIQEACTILASAIDGARSSKIPITLTNWRVANRSFPFDTG